MNQEIEFAILLDDVEISSTPVSVSGRCYKEPIRVGDVFEAVYQLVLLKAPDGSYEPPIRVGDRPASLQVEAILWYGHSVDELPTGHTGQLMLTGSGGESLKMSDVVGMQQRIK